MARKSKYSQAIQDKLCEFVRNGITIKSMCQAVNIGERTYYDWMRDNSQFSQAIKKAEGERDYNVKSIAIHTMIQAMLDGTWQAAAWWLERKFPSEFKNVQEQVQKYDIDGAREKLKKILDNNEPKRASNS